MTRLSISLLILVRSALLTASGDPILSISSKWAHLDKVGVRVPAYASASRPEKAMMYDNTSNASNNKKTGLGLTGILQNVAHGTGSSERRPAPAAPKTFNNNRTSVVEEVALEDAPRGEDRPRPQRRLRIHLDVVRNLLDSLLLRSF